MDTVPQSLDEPTTLGKQFTLLVHARMDGEQRILCQLVRILTMALDAERLSVTFRTDHSDTPLRVGFPIERIGAGRDATIVVRYTGVRLQLFVDGVHVDEEWPAGQISRDPVFPNGSDCSATLWSTALDDPLIVALCGGAEYAAKRDEELLGVERWDMPYWHPRGDRTGSGDCMPFFHEGRFHVFYLFDRRKHSSKWGKGGHEWAHVSTTDLRTWTSHPMAVSIEEEWEASFCTGSMFAWDGRIYAFYTVRTLDGSPAPLMTSVSDDCVSFVKNTRKATLTVPYLGASARDPVVFHDPRTRLFHMLLTTSIAPIGDEPAHGALAHLTSTDLVSWQQHPPFREAGIAGGV